MKTIRLLNLGALFIALGWWVEAAPEPGSALSAAAPPRAAECNINVHAVTFRVPEATIGLEALNVPPQDEGAFFDRLAEMAERGEVEIVFDELVIAASGREKSAHDPSDSFGQTKAVDVLQFIYPTEYEPNAVLFQLQPTAFETRYLGQSLVCEPWAFSNLVDTTFDAGEVRTELFPWPVPNPRRGGGAAAMGSLPLPHMFSWRTTTSLTCSSGEPRLVSVTPAAPFASTPGSAAGKSLITFARAIIDEPTSAPAALSEEKSEPFAVMRYQVVGLRLARDEAALWLWRRDSTREADNFAGLTGRVSSGAVEIFYNAACSTRSGQRCITSTIREFIYPTEWEFTLLPRSFETRNLGRSLELEPTIGPDGVRTDVAIAAQYLAHPVLPRLPVDGRDRELFTTFPEFPNTQITTAMTLPLGGVRLLGAAAATPAMAEPGLSADKTDLYFLKSAGASVGRPPSQPGDLIELQALVFSLSADEGRVLKAAIEDPSAAETVVDELIERVESGQCHIATHACLTQRSGNRSKVVCSIERHNEETIHRVPGHPSAICRTPNNALEIGTSFEAESAPESDGNIIVVSFALDYHPAPLERLTIEELSRTAQSVERRAKRDSSAPNDPAQTGRTIRHRDFEEKFRSEKLKLRSGEARLIEVRESAAPVGAAEGGRWHALAVRATALR